jgi:hypothetical protein
MLNHVHIAVLHHLVLQKELFRMIHLGCGVLSPKKEAFERSDAIVESPFLLLESLVAALKMTNIFGGFVKNGSL